MFKLNSAPPSLVIVDDIYEDPGAVRAFALEQEFHLHEQYHKGYRTEQRFLFPGLQERIERALGAKIDNFEKYGTNGIFQYCTAKDPIVYHADSQQYAGAIYLNYLPPLEAGTRLLRRKGTHVRSINEREADRNTQTLDELRRDTLGGDQDFYDGTKWETVDQAGNLFNRLVLWNSQLIHAAGAYFGLHKTDARLFQLFFFDLVPGSVPTITTPLPEAAKSFLGQTAETAPAPVKDSEEIAKLMTEITALQPDAAVLKLLGLGLEMRDAILKRLWARDSSFHNSIMEGLRALG